MTSDPEVEAEGVDEQRAAAEANIRWLLAAVLHHETDDDADPAGRESGQDGEPADPDQPGGGEIDTSRNGGSHPSSP